MTRIYAGETVVIGGGLAGVVTALALCDHGRKVVLLDRASAERFGGLARMSFGGIFCVGSPEQKLMGIRDNVDLALDDWIAYGELTKEDHWPRRWAESFVHRSLELVRGYLVARGVRFLPGVNWTERGYFVPGNSVPRFHVAWGCGEGIVKPLVARLNAYADQQRLQLHFQHTVAQLLQEGGRFIGAEGHDDTGRPFQARGEHVVLAAGGLAGDLNQVRRHWPADLGSPPERMLNGSIPEADGRFFDLAPQWGARVTHLDRMWNYAAGVRHWAPRWPLHGLSLVPGKSALWVTSRGERFKDPPLVGAYDTHLLMQRICTQPKAYSWQVLNRRILCRELAVSGAEHNREIRDGMRLGFLRRLLFGNQYLADEFISNCPDFVQADSLPALVERMNALEGNADVDLEILAAEVQRYDANLARGGRLHNDDQIRRIAHTRRYLGDRLRTCNLQPILDAGAKPLIAIRLSILTRKSLGGFQTDLQSRVLSVAGTPLPGLYAVGEAAGFGGGGIHGKRALEGTFLAGCLVSAQAAAESILHQRGLDGRP